ncbi:hypothetical protein BRD01_02320 [Halobacteriales archaeon QS_8_65_32]|nr:MAG: hypothetical protein BRD01_02320 [Halobacteriales archaeon QS_8_65_32]
MGFLSRVAGAGGAIALSSAGIGTAAAGGSGAGTASDESDENGSDGDNGGDTDEDGSEALSDVDVLNFALTLEHLEAAYYDEFLSEYSESEIERSEAARVFADPGSRFSTYQKIQQVRDHERAHVETLTATIEDLGGTPVEPAEHDFPYETIDEFVSLSATIEAVGVSAYAGAAPLIENDDVLAAALSIHSVEARHTAYFRVLDTNTPFPNAIDPTRTMEEVLDVASQFIVSMDSEGDSDGGDGSDENDGGDDDGARENSRSPTFGRPPGQVTTRAPSTWPTRTPAAPRSTSRGGPFRTTGESRTRSPTASRSRPTRGSRCTPGGPVPRANSTGANPRRSGTTASTR